MLIQLHPPMYTPPIHFKKIDKGDGTMFPLKNMLNIIVLKASVSSASIFLTCNKPRETRGHNITPK